MTRAVKRSARVYYTNNKQNNDQMGHDLKTDGLPVGLSSRALAHRFAQSSSDNEKSARRRIDRIGLVQRPFGVHHSRTNVRVECDYRIVTDPDQRPSITSDIADMGVLYDVLFKPIGRSDLSTATTVVTDVPTAVSDAQLPPEWVLDRRDSGSLVWCRYGLQSSCRRHVRFLDAVQVREFERDDCTDRRDDCAADVDDCGTDADDEDGQLFWADDWSLDRDDDGQSKTSFCRRRERDDYPMLVAVSVTVLGMCIGLTYLFAPVKWLLHQLLVD
ncbi:hypothetical protein QTP88_004992 [Uroleucon formosanum]